MMPRLSAREEQTLSDYLDGRLSEGDAAAFEKRLKENETLRQAASDLRCLKSVLRGSPRYRLPRNFTLTPEMIKKTTPGWINFWLPAMRFASVMAVFLLVAVYVFEFLPGGIPALRKPPVNLAMENTIMQKSGEAVPGGVQSTPPPIIIWNMPAYGRGGGAEEQPAAPEQRLSNEESGSEIEAPAENKQMDTYGETTGEVQGLMAPAPQLSAESTPIPAEAPSPSASEKTPPEELPFAGAGGGGGAPPPMAAEPRPVEPVPTIIGHDAETPLILGLAPTDQRAVIITPETAEMIPPAQQADADRKKGFLWTWIKLALALTALTTATAVVLIQRKARK